MRCLTVNVTVSGSSLLFSNPQQLSFTSTVGTPQANIPTQTLTISSSGQQLSYNVTAVTLDGHFWLIPFATGGTTGNAASDTITVGVNPAGLGVNTYQGTITVQSTSTADSVVIDVTLTLGAGTTLSVTPSTLLPFLYQLGTVAQPGQLTQTVQVSSTNSSVAFTTSMNPQVCWLVIEPPNGATGAGGAAVPVSFLVNPSCVGVGVSNTQVTIGINGGPPAASINVQLVVSTNPLLQISANVLDFTAQFGGGAPPAGQPVQVTALGNPATPVPFLVSIPANESWLTYTTTSFATPATITVNVNPATLPVGTTTGTLTITPNNSDSGLYSLPITVNVNVGSNAQVSAGPPLLVFAWETTQPVPQPQVVELETAGQPVAFSLSTSTTTAANCPASWLTVTSNSTTTQNAILTVTPTVTGMTPGICSGTVTVTYPAGSMNPANLSIPVTVNVSNSALLNISFSQGFGTVSAAQGANPINQSITLTSTDPAVPVTDISSSSSSNGPSTWLSVVQNGASTPQALPVTIQPGSLPINTYSGSITISSSKLPSSPQIIPVTLTIIPSITVSLSSTSLSFQQALGGPVPTMQQVTLTSSASGATFETSVPSNLVCSWLQVSPSSGVASGAVTFKVLQNSLTQNSYVCPVLFTFLNSATPPVTVNATLTVGAAQTLTAAPASLTFTYQLTQSAPGVQQLTLTSTGGLVTFTAAEATMAPWLTINPTSGSTGSSGSTPINVSINPAAITPAPQAGAVLSDAITISAPGVLATPLEVPITLNITAAPAPSPVTVRTSAVLNGFGAIAPGELITIQGANLGPPCSGLPQCISNGVQFSVTNGMVSSTLAGVEVLFDTIPGTPTFVSPTQINVIVPWEIAGRVSTNMVVSYSGALSTALPLQVASVMPGIFTQNATGAGQAAALNLSSPISVYNGPAGGTYFGNPNIPTAPAPHGTTIVLILTGGGVTNPASVTGSINPDAAVPLKNWTPTSGTVTATIGGQPATVIYAGAAPTLITGVVQINLGIPLGVSGPALPVVITIDGQQTQTTATIAVQ